VICNDDQQGTGCLARFAAAYLNPGIEALSTSALEIFSGQEYDLVRLALAQLVCTREQIVASTIAVGRPVMRISVGDPRSIDPQARTQGLVP
jgi:hypothetical protein